MKLRMHKPGWRRWLPGSTSVMFCLAMLAGPAQSADPGEEAFIQQCGTCHTLSAGDGPRAGPNLHGLWARPAGSVAGFDYSDALRTAGFRWDAQRLDRWLTDSSAFIPDSYMNYQQDDAALRKVIIAYLQKHAR